MTRRLIFARDRRGSGSHQSSSDEPRHDAVDMDDDAPPPTQTQDFGDPATPAFEQYVRAAGLMPVPVLPRPPLQWQDGGDGSTDVTPRTQMWSNFVGGDQMRGYRTMGAAGASSSAQAAWGPEMVGPWGAESSAQAERRIPSPDAALDDPPPGGIGEVPVPPLRRSRSRRGGDERARAVRGRVLREGQRDDPIVQPEEVVGGGGIRRRSPGGGRPAAAEGSGCSGPGGPPGSRGRSWERSGRGPPGARRLSRRAKRPSSPSALPVPYRAQDMEEP